MGKIRSITGATLIEGIDLSWRLADSILWNIARTNTVGQRLSLGSSSLKPVKFRREFGQANRAKVHSGRLTSAVKDEFKALIINSISTLIRDRVNERLTSALTASNPAEDEDEAGAADEVTFTREDEVAGFNIVRAIAAKAIDPKRIVMRDAKSYCAVLLDDNNRKTIVRLHFNSPTARYLGTFSGKEETRHSVAEPVHIYQHDEAILKRVAELVG